MCTQNDEKSFLQAFFGGVVLNVANLLLPLPARSSLLHAGGEADRCTVEYVNLLDAESLFAQTFGSAPAPHARLQHAMDAARLFVNSMHPAWELVSDMQTKGLLLLSNPRLAFVQAPSDECVVIVQSRRQNDSAGGQQGERPAPAPAPAKGPASARLNVPAPKDERAGLFVFYGNS